MTNWCENTLTVSGPINEIQKFLNGLEKKGKKYRLLGSYFPCPKELEEMEVQFLDIGYEAYFNPDPSGYLKVLELPEIREHGIETRKQLTEFLWNEKPEYYYDGLRINNNLFELGYRNWYCWRRANWGTRSDCFAEIIEQGPKSLVFEFSSAWSPPVLGFDHIATLFPKLEFELSYWNECGWESEISGRTARWVNGKREAA